MLTVEAIFPHADKTKAGRLIRDNTYLKADMRTYLLETMKVEDRAESGIVYIIRYRDSGVVKVGSTIRTIDKRYPGNKRNTFEVLFEIYTEDCRTLEESIQNICECYFGCKKVGVDRYLVTTHFLYWVKENLDGGFDMMMKTT